MTRDRRPARTGAARSAGARGGALALVAVVLLAGGVTAGMALAPQAEPQSVRSATPPAAVPVSRQVFDDARKVKVTPVVAEEGTLSVADQGKVTRSVCAPGAVIESGSSPATVDDRPVVALATSIPLWRDLAPTAKGDDVKALQVELSRLGHKVSADGTYGDATKVAVTKLFKAAGVAKPTGDLPVASVLWLPAASVTVKACEVPVGGATSEEAFATTAGTLVSLGLSDTLSNVTPGDRVLRLGELSAPVGEGGVVTDPTFLEAVRGSMEFAGWQRTEGSEPLTLEYVLAAPLDVSVVPPGSLFALSGATGCVSADGTAYPVTVVASSLGQTLVTFDGLDAAAAPTEVELTSQEEGQTCR
ncbi:peptidoglycan-binding domain-containing protein [Oerskovia jenensis]|uniref:peptidoglycan-binding domain-containing protein n=1 Tax=Oerskovia jenensis TaxID=162169 RepID=UPI0036DEB31D